MDARNPQLEMAQTLLQHKPVFALPGCQQMSVNSLCCVILWGWLTLVSLVSHPPVNGSFPKGPCLTKNTTTY